MDVGLKDKVVLISGGSRGIGSKICEAFVSEKSKVYFMYKSNDEEANNTANRIKEKYVDSTIVAIKADVCDEEQCVKAVEKIKEIEGTIDVLVNNAGITRDNLMLVQNKKEWKSVLDVTIDGTYNLTHEVALLMFGKRRGTIINISSIAGLTGVMGQTNYCTAKAGIIGFTKALSKELGMKNVRVNAIAPGYIETDMTKDLSNLNSIKKQIPLRRLGKPEDIANLVLFLASDLSSYINGEVITIDGGLTS